MTHCSNNLLILAGSFALSTVVMAPAGHAASQFDGEWNMLASATSGTCDHTYRFAGHIVNGIIYYVGGDVSSFSGRVAPSGAVSITLSGGPNHVVASGRIKGNSGAGTWRGAGPNGACQGSWSAARQ